MLQGFSLLHITLQSFHHLNLNLKMISLATKLSTPLQHASLMLNTNRPISVMLPSIKTTSHLTSIVIFSIYFPNIKNCLMAPLEFILIKRFTLTSNLEQSQCITALILFLMYIAKPLKRNLTTWLNSASSNIAAPLNGCSQPSLFLKRIVTFNKLLIYAH